MHFWLTSASADFKSGKSISRREQLAVAIPLTTGAPLLRSSVNAGVPSTDSTARIVSPVAPCYSPDPSCRLDGIHNLNFSAALLVGATAPA